jgi:hypothetical protein
MIRRCTTTLLMMVFLAGQLAVVPHAHASCIQEQPPDHDARLHVHVSCFDHDEHSHDDGHLHHHECDNGHSQPHASQSIPAQDHDRDAVYLPTNAGDSLLVKSVVPPGSFQVVASFVVAATLAPSAASESWAAADFPDKCSPGCPLYLALRALRI